MPDLSGRRSLTVLVICAFAAAASVARAAEATYKFDVARKPLSAALVDLAVQADASISTRGAEACAQPAARLVGRYTLEAALARLLNGTGCTYRLIDARAVEIAPLARTPPIKARHPEPPPAPVADLPELIVVATRRPTLADRLAYPVSAVEAGAIAAQGVRDAADLAAIMPAMTVTNLGAGRDKILLRGLSDGPLTGRTQSMVGIYLDDVRITYNAPDPDLRLVDMAQVEVLRGPQGALYGAGSLGGVLHLITAQADPDAFGASVAATVGVTRGGDPSSEIEGVVNLPVLAGRGAVRAVGYREVLGGYIDDAGLGLRNVNRSVRQGGRLAVRLDVNPKWTLTAGLVGQFINADDTQYAFAALPSYTRATRLREPHDNDFVQGHVGVLGDLGGAEMRWNTAVVRHHLTSRYDASVAPPVSLAGAAAAFDDKADIASTVSEAVVTSKPGARVQWLAGAFYARTRQDTDLQLAALTAPSLVAFAEGRRDRLSETALFGEAILPLTRDLNLTLGGRAFISDVHVTSVIAAPSVGSPTAFRGGLRDSGFAPKAVLAYAASPQALLYIQAAEGYRAGGINTTGVPGQPFSATGGAQPLRRYHGDELWSLEAGGRFSFDDGRLTLRTAVFEAFWKNIQSDQLLPSALPFTANIGDGRNLGLEAEAAYRAGDRTVRADLLVNGPELDRVNPAFTSRKELNLAGVPKVSAGLAAQYGWNLPSNLRLELDTRYAYVGPSRLTFDAATSPSMGDYATGRIAATLAAERWGMTLAVENPAGVRGDTFAYGNPFSLRTTRQVTPLRPLTASATLRIVY